MEKRTKEPRIKSIRREKSQVQKGVDTRKFCGILNLKEDPLLIQQRLRNEWK